MLDETDSPSSASTPAKGKKGKGAAAPPDLDGMDEVDRALAELKLKYGDDPAPQAGLSQAEANAPKSALAFRTLLSVEPKNLDADAELRRFFGSKVVSHLDIVPQLTHRLLRPHQQAETAGMRPPSQRGATRWPSPSRRTLRQSPSPA